MVYKTSGVCSSAISFEIDDAGKVHDVKFQGGCSGNTQGVARLVEGMDAKEAISRSACKSSERSSELILKFRVETQCKRLSLL